MKRWVVLQFNQIIYIMKRKKYKYNQYTTDIIIIIIIIIIIDYCLTSSEQYFSYIQNDYKFNKI